MTYKFVVKLTDECKCYEQDVDYLERVYGAEPIKEHDEEIYSKAIDDFVNACKEDILCQTFGLHVNGIGRIAEQLKAGIENGTGN